MVIGKEMGQLPVADRRQIVGNRERSPEVALGHQPHLSAIVGHGSPHLIVGVEPGRVGGSKARSVPAPSRARRSPRRQGGEPFARSARD
jgi:hypothetical protein